MRPKNKITVEWLHSEGANCRGLKDFQSVFPFGATITPENCLKAVANRLNIDWFAGHYLQAPARAAYENAKAQALYEAIMGQKS